MAQEQEQVLFESSIRELSRLTLRALAVLSPSNSVPDPVRYQEVIRCISELRQMWADHMVLHSRASSIILASDPHFTDFLTALDREGSDFDHQLSALSSAAWPRSSGAAMYSVRGRIAETLTALHHQVDRERTTVLPLLRRWCSEQSSETTCSALRS